MAYRTVPDLSDLTVFIQRDGNELVTDSRAVAVAFGKQHKDVLRIINRMAVHKRPEIAEHARRNFAPNSYVDQLSRQKPMYRMTAKGLAELTMGFTGDDACVVRIRFIDAFEEMAQRLASAERTLTQQMHAIEVEEGPSIGKGRIGGKLLSERKKEKRGFDEQRGSLLALLQPSLFGPH